LNSFLSPNSNDQANWGLFEQASRNWFVNGF
jgi:hypothetical protein